jgi:hypothetical protein
VRVDPGRQPQPGLAQQYAEFDRRIENHLRLDLSMAEIIACTANPPA